MAKLLPAYTAKALQAAIAAEQEELETEEEERKRMEEEIYRERREAQAVPDEESLKLLTPETIASLQSQLGAKTKLLGASKVKRRPPTVAQTVEEAIFKYLGYHAIPVLVGTPIDDEYFWKGDTGMTRPEHLPVLAFEVPVQRRFTPLIKVDRDTGERTVGFSDRDRRCLEMTCGFTQDAIIQLEARHSIRQQEGEPLKDDVFAVPDCEGRIAQFIEAVRVTRGIVAFRTYLPINTTVSVLRSITDIVVYLALDRCLPFPSTVELEDLAIEYHVDREGHSPMMNWYFRWTSKSKNDSNKLRSMCFDQYSPIYENTPMGPRTVPFELPMGISTTEEEKEKEEKEPQ